MTATRKRAGAGARDPRRRGLRHYFVAVVDRSSCGACDRPAGDPIHKRPGEVAA